MTTRDKIVALIIHGATPGERAAALAALERYDASHSAGRARVMVVHVPARTAADSPYRAADMWREPKRPAECRGWTGDTYNGECYS